MHPTVHLNGTSRDALLDGYHTAARAVSAAIQALCDVAPNARDYYPQGPDAFAVAQSEHAMRLANLGVVKGELMDIFDRLAEGADTAREISAMIGNRREDR